jgi:hypothetical protein
MNDFPTLHRFPEGSVRGDYDVFELFPDASTVWQACVLGMGNAERKLRKFARESNSKFFASNLQGRAYSATPEIVAPERPPWRQLKKRVKSRCPRTFI